MEWNVMTQFESRGLETVYGGYPEDGVPFWPDWDCQLHNLTIILQQDANAYQQGERASEQT